jgi:hypothetical protein
MSVNHLKPTEINHSTYGHRLSELEAGYKKLDELLITVADLSMQVKEIQTKVKKKTIFLSKMMIYFPLRFYTK